LTLALVLTGTCLLSAQEDVCKLLDREAARMFVPDRIPMETELLAVDAKNLAAIQFADKSRIAFAAITSAGLSAQLRSRYQYVLISEARLQLGGINLAPGMAGLSMQEDGKNAASGFLVVRDVSGREIDRLALKQEPEAKGSSISLTPTGAREFELHIGKYVIQGAQR